MPKILNFEQDLTDLSPPTDSLAMAPCAAEALLEFSPFFCSTQLRELMQLNPTEARAQLFKQENITYFREMMHFSSFASTEDKEAYLDFVNRLFLSLSEKEKNHFLSFTNTKDFPVSHQARFLNWPLLSEMIHASYLFLPYALRTRIESIQASPTAFYFQQAFSGKKYLSYLQGKLIYAQTEEEKNLIVLEIIRSIEPDEEINQLYQTFPDSLLKLTDYYQEKLRQNILTQNEGPISTNSQLLNSLNSILDASEYIHTENDKSLFIIAIGEAYIRHHPYIKIDQYSLNLYLDCIKGIILTSEYTSFQTQINELATDKKQQLKLIYLRECIRLPYDYFIVANHYVNYFLTPSSQLSAHLPQYEFDHLSQNEQALFWQHLKSRVIDKKISEDNITTIAALINHIKSYNPDILFRAEEHFLDPLIDHHGTLDAENGLLSDLLSTLRSFTRSIAAPPL